MRLCEGLPPVSLRAERGSVSEDGEDVVVSGASLRIGDTTVLPVPWLWLRGPRRLGLHAPFVGYRGGGFGPAAGLGVHVPLGPASLDVVPVVSTRGAFDVGAVASADRVTLAGAWERVKGDDRVAVAARGGGEAGAGAWSLRGDAIRGSRAKVGTADLEVAARPFDRAALGAELHAGAATAGVAVEGVGPRGLGPFEVGPSAGFGAMVPLGRWGTAFAGARVRTLSTSEASRSDGLTEAGATLSRFVGPVRAEAAVRGRAELDTLRDEAATLRGVGRAAIGLPLTRPDRTVLVDLDPRVEAGGGGARGDTAETFALGRLGVAVRTARRDARVEMAAGRSSVGGDVAQVTAAASGRWLLVRASAERDRGVGRVFAAGELFRDAPIGVLGRVTAAEARGRADTAWTGFRPSPVFERGVSYEAGLTSRVGVVTAVVRGAWDAVHDARLGTWADLYVSPRCGCFALGGTAGQRPDRGVDALVRFALVR